MRFFLALLSLAFATDTPANPECIRRIVKSVQVVLVIDGSGSVPVEGFATEVRLANSVLNSIREMYNEIDEDETATLSWAALRFAGDVISIKKMHVDEGPQDGIPEDLQRICPAKYGTDGGPGPVCGTWYKPALNEAKSLFAPGEGEKFLWFLTDGRAYDITSAKSMKKFRQSFNGDGSIAIESVYLTPDESSITSARAVLQALVCPESDLKCTDHVLTGHTSTDMTVFSKKAQDMARELVEEFVSNGCPKTSTATIDTGVDSGVTTSVNTNHVDSGVTTTTVTTNDGAATSGDSVSLAALAVAIVAALACLVCCCCFILKRKKKTPLEEEEQSKMQQASGSLMASAPVPQPSKNTVAEGASRTRSVQRKRPRKVNPTLKAKQ